MDFRERPLLGCETLSEPGGPGGEKPSWLTSITRFSTWPARKPARARCAYAALHEPDGSGIPHASCSCGVYAVSDLDVLKEVADPMEGTQDHAGGVRTVVVGTVAIWGRIVPGEWGWRGEQAYPNELWVVRDTVRADEDALELAARLHTAYGVPVGVCDAAWALPRDIRLPAGADTVALAAAAWNLSHSLDRLASAASRGQSAYEEELRRFFSRAGIGIERTRPPSRPAREWPAP
ncbi:MAG TPA: hypothetical protein VII47_10960 [Actinomycetota bacterium]